MPSKTIPLLIAATLFTAAVSPGPAEARAISAGVALADFDDVGIKAHLTQGFVLKGSRLSTGLTYFTDAGVMVLDADVHLALSGRDLSAYYPIVGLGLATDLDEADLGLNAGLGYRFGLTSRTRAAVEGKFVFGGVDAFVASFIIHF
jgi:hypothetical protein